ncbi:diguanylate cyclase [Aliiroseovarius sp.]|uniref:diguanylate cyclase domain-containing protein n=1 Tax=Aliiroseovarius sp. TaxID=1872442 RepID=UPI0026280941|nr:diguanylate cyclase [Aliiroseovarius sp.]
MAGRILIADGVTTSRIMLKGTMKAARHAILQADNAAQVLRMARRDRPGLIILGESLVDGGAVQLLGNLKADPLLARIPVVVVAAGPDRAMRLAALRAGADEVVTKPYDDATLQALARNLMRARTAQDELDRRRDTARELGFAEIGKGFACQARLALVAPDMKTAIHWRAGLGRMTRDRVTLMSREEAIGQMPAGTTPDAFVVAASIDTPGDGLPLVSELRSRQATRHAVIIVKVSEEDPAHLTSMALDLGANAVQTGPFDAEELAIRLRPLLHRKLESDALRADFDSHLSLAVTDPLTGVYNRRYAQGYLDRIAREARDTGQSFAVMALDLDRFKSVNDTYGHLVGDEVLVEVARRLRENLREIDLLARTGGEEFIIALPATTSAQAGVAAERLRRMIGDTPVHSPSRGMDIPVTMSIGVAIGDRLVGDVNTLLERADRALYASKAEGRNQVTMVQTAA